jgi:hypothetical protein
MEYFHDGFVAPVGGIFRWGNKISNKKAEPPGTLLRHWTRFHAVPA